MKTLLLLLLSVHLIAFGDIKSNTSRLFEKREVVGEGYQKVKYTTSSFKITGLGNYDELTYRFENFGNGFFKKNNEIEPAIEIRRLWIEPLDAVVDKDNKVIFGFTGNCSLRVRAIVDVKNSPILSGTYESYPILLILVGREKNGYSRDSVMIELKMELDIIKALKISTTPMNLGVGIQGQKMSSAQGNHGYLNIEGEADRVVEVSYPREVEIFNTTGKGSINVEVFTPDLVYTRNENYLTRLSGRGEGKVTFFGQVRDTRKATPGSYSGELKIKVRYN